MKTVCFLTQSAYEIDPRVRRKAEALVAKGYEVDVLALRGVKPEKTFTLNGVNVRTISIGKLRASLLRYFVEYACFLAWAFYRVFVQMRRRRYTMVDVNTLPDFLIFAAAPARWMGAKLILDMHEITPEFYMSKYEVARSSWAIRLVEYLEKISFDYADYVITINEPVLELLVGRGLNPAKAIVMMNSADEARFAAIPRPPAAQGNAPKFVMMYHGTLTRIYGLDIAVEAFDLAKAEMPGAELWILGDGPEAELLKAMAVQRNLTGKVKLLGLVPSSEIPGWLSQAHAGILPIRKDVFLDFAFPNKLPEFIIAGKPVLMARLRAVRHYFSEQSLAYFEPNDAAALAKQMVRLYQDHNLRAELVAKAKEEYVPIRWDVMKARYLNLVDGTPSDHGAGQVPQQEQPAETTAARG